MVYFWIWFVWFVLTGVLSVGTNAAWNKWDVDAGEDWKLIAFIFGAVGCFILLFAGAIGFSVRAYEASLLAEAIGRR